MYTLMVQVFRMLLFWALSVQFQPSGGQKLAENVGLWLPPGQRMTQSLQTVINRFWTALAQFRKSGGQK